MLKPKKTFGFLGAENALRFLANHRMAFALHLSFTPPALAGGS